MMFDFSVLFVEDGWEKFVSLEMLNSYLGRRVRLRVLEVRCL